MGRRNARAGFDHETRLSLVEDDLDKSDKQFEHVVSSLDGMRKMLVGILVSVTTASLMLVINIIAAQT